MSPISIATNPKIYIRGTLNDRSFPSYDITNRVAGTWNHTIRAQGGYWTASCQMAGKLSDMLNIFNNWLGLRVEENTAGISTWEGIIYEIDLSYHGITRRVSLDLVYNYIKVLYQDEEGDTQTTAVGSITDSIGRYGRQEMIHTSDFLTATAATAFRDTLLNSWGWPYVKPVGATFPRPEPITTPEPFYTSPDRGPLDIATLDIQCCGMIYTANWRFEQVGDGSADNLSDWISEILTTDCEFLYPSIINTNTLQVYKDTSQPRRCWDLLQTLVGLGDTSGNPYRIYCDNNAMVNYEQISTTALYFVRNGRLHTAAGRTPINPWMMKPGVVRDEDMFVSMGLGSGWLTDRREFYPDEISVDASGNVRMKTIYFDEGDLIISQLQGIEALFEPEED